MNCLEFYKHLLSSPDSMDAEFIHHKKQCNQCEHLYSEIKNFDNDLAGAMSINVPERLQSAIISRVIPATAVNKSRSGYYALAAGLLIFISAAFITLRHGDNHDLNKLVLSYVEAVDITGSLNAPVNYQTVDEILRPLGMKLDSKFGTIQAAKPCVIRGNAAAHLVLPGDKRPIDILYMPFEEIDQRIQVNRHDLQLVLIPCPKGSLAIVGSTGEQLAIIEQRLQIAGSWL